MKLILKIACAIMLVVVVMGGLGIWFGSLINDGINKKYEDYTSAIQATTPEEFRAAIENKQNLIVEGCYIPTDWKKYFDKYNLEEIKAFCLVMSEKYIRNNFEDIRKYENVVENRIFNDCTMESLIEGNKAVLEDCLKHNAEYVLIDNEYKIDVDI